MHAIQVQAHGGPETLRFTADAPVPELQAGEVLVRLHSIGVNFVDVYHRTGLYPAPLPMIPGMEVAGVVEGVGEGVTEFKAGERVCYPFARGAYAELAVVPADKLVLVPAGLSDDQATTLMLQVLTGPNMPCQPIPA